ncbi:MAG: hypothetical protein WDN49_17715 [Acetobacteraceae bacterium]
MKNTGFKTDSVIAERYRGRVDALRQLCSIILVEAADMNPTISAPWAIRRP